MFMHNRSGIIAVQNAAKKVSKGLRCVSHSRIVRIIRMKLNGLNCVPVEVPSGKEPWLPVPLELALVISVLLCRVVFAAAVPRTKSGACTGPNWTNVKSNGAATMATITTQQTQHLRCPYGVIVR